MSHTPPADTDRRDPHADVYAVSAIAYGFMGSQLLYAALEANLFTELAQRESASLDALASTLGVERRLAEILVTGCLALGLLEQDGDRYRNSPASARFLAGASPAYMGDYYLRQIAPIMYSAAPRARELVLGRESSAPVYADMFGDEGVAEDFIRGQHAGSVGPARLFARTESLAEVGRLLDLGGGSGAFSIAAAKRHPGLTAVVLDFPAVTRIAGMIIAEEGVSDRVGLSEGDVRTTDWPPADAVLLSYIVSSYGPATMRELFERAFEHVPSGGQLFVHDFALDADRAGPPLTAMWLFANLGASGETHAYSVDDLRAAMAAAGFVELSDAPLVPGVTSLLAGRKP